jgi:hypothetical protein
MTNNISSYDDEALDLGDGFGVQRSIGTPSPGKFCCLCSKRILLGQVAHSGSNSGSNAGFSVCEDCVRIPGSADATAATPSTGQRPDGDDGDGGGAPDGIAARLDFDAATGGLPESCDGPPPRESRQSRSRGSLRSRPSAPQLQCVVCSSFGARYFSKVEKDVGEAWCLRCRRLDGLFNHSNPGNPLGLVFEEEELPDSEQES